MPLFVPIASWQKQIVTSQNRRAQPFYKPPTHVTRCTALAFQSFQLVQPNHLRCRETQNESITAKRSQFCDACVENRPELRRMLHFFHTIKQLKTKDLSHSNNGQEVKHFSYNPCAAFTADQSKQTMSGACSEYLSLVTLVKCIPLNAVCFVSRQTTIVKTV